MAGKVKMADVARASGVSVMTVSRVLNGLGGASPETIARVRLVAEQMGYRPNALARALKSDRSGTVGVIVPDIANPFFPEIIRGVENVANQNGYTVLLCNVVESPDQEISVMRALESQRVDGIIWCSARLPEPGFRKALEAYRAAVVVNRQVSPGIAGSIIIDYRSGAADAARHLWEAGRRSIGVLLGPAQSQGGIERLTGIQSAFQQLGGEPVAIVHCGPDVPGGAEACREILDANPTIDGLICYNDLNSIGVLQTCEARGVRIPDDIAVIGFDGIPLTEFVRPQLSTLHVDKYSVGQLAMRMLIDRIDGKFTQHSIVVRPELIARASSAQKAPA